MDRHEFQARLLRTSAPVALARPPWWLLRRSCSQAAPSCSSCSASACQRSCMSAPYHTINVHPCVQTFLIILAIGWPSPAQGVHTRAHASFKYWPSAGPRPLRAPLCNARMRFARHRSGHRQADRSCVLALLALVLLRLDGQLLGQRQHALIGLRRRRSCCHRVLEHGVQ